MCTCACVCVCVSVLASKMSFYWKLNFCWLNLPPQPTAAIKQQTQPPIQMHALTKQSSNQRQATQSSKWNSSRPLCVFQTTNDDDTAPFVIVKNNLRLPHFVLLALHQIEQEKCFFFKVKFKNVHKQILLVGSRISVWYCQFREKFAVQNRNQSQP